MCVRFIAAKYFLRVKAKMWKVVAGNVYLGIIVFSKNRNQEVHLLNPFSLIDNSKIYMYILLH